LSEFTRTQPLRALRAREYARFKKGAEGLGTLPSNQDYRGLKFEFGLRQFCNEVNSRECLKF